MFTFFYACVRFGNGRLVYVLNRKGYEITGIDLYEKIFEFSFDYFHLIHDYVSIGERGSQRPPGFFTSMDASKFVQEEKLKGNKYDVILHDLYSGGKNALMTLVTFSFSLGHGLISEV